MSEWDGHEGSCSCDCGFDIPKGGHLKSLTLEDITGIANLIYPVGSIYMSLNPVNPSTLFGGTWEQIEDRFLLAAGATYKGGTENANGVSSKVTVNIPNHKHLTPLVKSGNYLGFWTGGDSKSHTSSNRIVVTGGTYTNSAAATSYYTGTDGACSTDVTVPPTLPPYMAVYVWRRVEDPIPENYGSLYDGENNQLYDSRGNTLMVEVV